MPVPFGYTKAGRERTHREIADELGVSRQRVWQVERSAMAKLRRGLEERGYALEDLLEQDARLDPNLYW